jgi:hypothetical protein
MAAWYAAMKHRQSITLRRMSDHALDRFGERLRALLFARMTAGECNPTGIDRSFTTLSIRLVFEITGGSSAANVGSNPKRSFARSG